MTVKVDLDQLADALADFTFAYLITVGDDYRAHTVMVEPSLADGILGVGPIGKSTHRNVEHHSDVTLVWPPSQSGGYSLIVDGTGHPTDDALTVAPTRAVLHRKAAPGSPTLQTDCLHDCVKLDK